MLQKLSSVTFSRFDSVTVSYTQKFRLKHFISCKNCWTHLVDGLQASEVEAGPLAEIPAQGHQQDPRGWLWDREQATATTHYYCLVFSHQTSALIRMDPSFILRSESVLTSVFCFNLLKKYKRKFIQILNLCFIFFALTKGFEAGAARSRGIWLEPEPSLWPGSGSTLNICLIIHKNYMALNIIWCLF